MDSGIGSSIPELKDFQIGSWVPATPAKPGLLTLEPICKTVQENQQITANWSDLQTIPQDFCLGQINQLEPGGFLQGNDALTRDDRCDLTNLVTDGGVNSWEAAVASKSSMQEGALNLENFSIDHADNWNNVSFGNLLALAHAAGTTAPVENAPAHTAFDPLFSSQNADGSSVSSRISFNLNSPPGRDAASSSNSFQFAPITPVQNKGRQSMLNLNLDINEIPILKDVQENVEESDLQGNKEQSVLVRELSEMMENHKPDKTGELVAEANNAEANKTPQQKPRRKKHRPKVVVEGKAKRANKPRAPNTPGTEEIKAEKRKYTPRKGVDKPAATPLDEDSHIINPEIMSPGSSKTPKVDRKHPKRNRGAATPTDEDSNVTNPETTPPGSKETPKVKRMYPQRNQVQKPTKDPIEEGSSETIQPETASRPRRSSRRFLNFDFVDLEEYENFIEPSSNFDNSHVKNMCEQVKSMPAVRLEQDEKSDAELTEVNISYDLINHEIGKSISQPGTQIPDPSNPSKIDLRCDKLMDGNQTKCTKGKCKIIFSDATHDKEDYLPEMTAPQCASSSQNSSNCSSNVCLTEEAQLRGSKRQHSCLAEAELYKTSIAGIHYNSLQAYEAILSDFDRSIGMPFPTIYKKKRTEKGQIPATSCSKNLNTETHNVNATSQFEVHGVQTNPALQSPKYLQPLNTDVLKRKRSKGLTRVRDLASLHEICKQFPTYSSRKAAAKQHTGHLNTCMEALVAGTRPTMKTKKRSKRNSLNGTVAPNTHAQHQYTRTPIGSLPALMWRGSSPIDEIVERFTYLNINADNQGQYTLSTRNVKFQRETALVLYQRDGTIAPFTGVKKRKPRPKVDLDDETTRVWKLLLQDINSQGIDGTDEEKTKWWEEERKVFRGRADSFIARMRLVQGDRRFSPWKGSVVDSVVGVFLTQNVSDHLSSSAFMSMAARFPLKSKISEQLHEERTNITIEEPEVCIMDPDDTIAWHENSLNQPTPGQDSMAFREMGCKDEVVNSELTEGTSNCIKSTENFKTKDVDSSEKDPEDVHYGLTLDRPAKWINEEEASFHSGQTEADNVLSSQNSGVSSQNSVNSSHTQTVDITESTSLCSTSFIQLLQMAGTSMLHGVYNQENNSANMDMPNQQRDCSAEFQKNKEDDKLPVSIGEHYALEQSESSTESPNQATNQKIIAGENPMVNSDSQIHTEESNCNLLLDQECPTSLDIQDITGRASTVVDSLSNSDGQNKHLDTVDKRSSNPSKEKGGRSGTEKQNAVNWDHLRQQALASGKKRERTMNTMDSLDWEAVRCADVNEIAETIKERGMNNMLAERIKDFLNRLLKEHGSTDLEWLRDVPPDKAKEYLLSFRGLGLKSVECVRLLTLHHLAFPVDTNVGRIAVRLGWVPLQPLPESLQLHLLELYPVLESIQKYLWPRLCKLDQGTLYELHYHMITFGKVFCTKSKPNCNACPMRAECRHFASAFASARLALPAPEDKSIVPAFENKPAEQNTVDTINPLQLLLPQSNEQSVAQYGVNNSQPIIEEPATPEPIIEVPSTPVPDQIPSEADIEDAYSEDPNEIPTINLNLIQLAQNVKMFVKNNMELNQVEMSKALVALTPEAASIPMPKLKNISRLRTEHNVYELPDNHPLLEGLEKRDPDDPCSYLLAIWTPGETANSVQPPEMRCDSQESGKLCQEETCFACNSIREAQSQTVRGTLLIPCRTAMRGSFPLNGTYFQVNEVFADHESSLNPIDVPRDWLWDLHRKTVFFGTSIPTIFKGLSTEDIQHCFWRGM
ncbi:protein ROS1A isoform X2 [Ipomoea triloba]|uniref:protein ROS1A isoform X2 n=1 Tax=Ipomoea triloba TaxID=35885 RepID=UPI00125D82A9|nr:protein ROS1A isoform X2 [Ipomoea triloba]